MNKAIGIAAVLAVFILCSAEQVAFGFYKWVDDQGVLHVTDSPPPAKYAPKPEPEPPAPVTQPAPPPVQKAVPPAPVVAPPPAQPTVPAPAVKPPTTAPAPVAKPAAPAPAPAPVVKPAAPAPPAQTVPTATVPGTVTAPAMTGPPTPGTPIPILPEPPKTSPTIPKELLPAAEALGALVGAFLMVFAGIAAAYYLYFSLCLFMIARKLNVGGSWLAWVPVIQLFWPFVGAAGKPGSWILLLLLPLLAEGGIRTYLQLAGIAIDPIWLGVLLLFTVFYVIVRIILWMSISQNLGKSRALGLLMLLPVVNLIVLGYLAFSKAE